MKVKLSSQIRVGKIYYVNTLPFYHGLVQEGDSFQVEEGYPTQMNLGMQEETLDLAPISSLEYANHPEWYSLLPGLCIASRDFSGSVLLFSREKLENLDGKNIAISKESFSSQALLKILLSQRFGFRNQFVVGSGNPEEMLREAAACLVIGDHALFYESKDFFYKYDLSELWYQWTQRAFCFSVWAVRKKFYLGNTVDVQTFHERLKQNTKQNLSQLVILIGDGLHLKVANERFARVFSYLAHLVYDLDEEVEEGLRHFFQLAKESKLVGEVPSLEFIAEKLP